ncbi:MAG TPA: hypothetical protein VJU78_17035 [Chitinophagaceae bacterium]|nr:hypothetical protein [Chitinophagaceae bacterium]
MIVDDDVDDRYLITRAFQDTLLPDKLQLAGNGEKREARLEDEKNKKEQSDKKNNLL